MKLFFQISKNKISIIPVFYITLRNIYRSISHTTIVLNITQIQLNPNTKRVNLRANIRDS